MSVFKCKTRMISFRLSEEQFSSLHDAALHQGARSVSDYAREALFRQLGLGPPGANGLEDRIHQLSFELDSLNRIVERLQTAVREPGQQPT